MKPEQDPRRDSAKAKKLSKREYAKKHRSEYRYAKVNKNLLIQEGSLGLLVLKKRLTGRGFILFLELVAEAQLAESQDPKFHTDIDWLHRLGLPVTAQERVAMYEALAALRSATLDLSWYHAEETRRIGYMEKLARNRLRRKRRAKQTRRRVINGILQYRIRIGGGFSVRFTDAFWAIISLDKFYCRIYLDVARRLRYPQMILLAGLLDAYGGRLHWFPEAIAQKIGLKPTKRGRLTTSIERAVGRIQEVTGQCITFRVHQNGKVLIRRVKKTGGLDDQNYIGQYL